MTKIRYKILSFALAAFVACVVLAGMHMLKQNQSGQAYAAPSQDAVDVLSAQDKRALKRVSSSPDYLLSLKGRDVIALLKTPEMVRQELPVTIWQYRAGGCVLDVYFKSDQVDVLQSQVAHYETRMRNTHTAALDSAGCMARVVEAHGGVRMVDVSAIFKSP